MVQDSEPLSMPDISIHLAPFLEILAAIVATPAVGYYVWIGLRRRKQARRQEKRMAAANKHAPHPWHGYGRCVKPC